MKLISQLLLAATLSILGLTASAQTTETTPNQITSGTTHTWTGVTTGAIPGGCATAGPCPGGPGALYDPNTNTIHFSYGQATVAQSFAINQALANSGSGIQVQGYNYSWDINNLNYDNRQGGTDTLTARVITFDPTGAIRRSDSWTYNTKFDWTTFSGSVNYVTPGPTSEFGNLRVEFSGVDSGFWGGYFGPQVRNVDVRLRYTVDQCAVNPQSSPTCPGYKTYYNMGDDGYSIIPLPFGYPLYGRTFTHSIMFDNGVVSFYDPVTEAARLGGQNYYSQPLSNNIGSQFHYSIMPLWTDLAPDSNSRYYTQTDNNNFFKYTWENIPQYGYANRRNTFGLEIRPTGYLGIQYNQINIEGYPITAGVVGNAELGEWTQHFRSEGTAVVTGGITNWSMNVTVPTDCSNALSNSACPGYAEAYFTQQCTANPLYSPSCPGYATAYFTQQCTINTLYNTQCPGYATAYYDYQCSVNPLYHTGCPNYSTAYFNQQCSLDPLYNEQCPGYSTAYFNQQCSLNPLYDTGCTGYADAYYVQQCTANPLYDSGCTGYADAYFAQQCSLDGLYSNQCPNYAEAYAKKNILNIGNTVATPTTETAVVVVTEEVKTESTTATPSETKVVADPVVNSVVTATSTSTNAAANPAAAVQLTAPAPAATTAVAAKTEEKKEEKKTETTASSSTSSPSTSSSNSSGGQKTTRQALAERRLEAARAAAVERGKNAGSEVANATSMEKQMELQNVVVAAMGFTPGFDAYGRVNLQDAIGYKPFVIYPGQRNIDTPAGRRLLSGSDRLHQEMVDAQYR